MATFIERFVTGEILPLSEEFTHNLFDDEVERWHENVQEEGCPIWEHLGMTRTEYDLCVMCPEVLLTIVRVRIGGKKIESNATAEISDKEILDWLDNNQSRSMRWDIGVAPSGNISISSVLVLGTRRNEVKLPTFRESAIQAMAGEKYHGNCR